MPAGISPTLFGNQIVKGILQGPTPAQRDPGVCAEQAVAHAGQTAPNPSVAAVLEMPAEVNYELVGRI